MQGATSKLQGSDLASSEAPIKRSDSHVQAQVEATVQRLNEPYAMPKVWPQGQHDKEKTSLTHLGQGRNRGSSALSACPEDELSGTQAQARHQQDCLPRSVSCCSQCTPSPAAILAQQSCPCYNSCYVSPAALQIADGQLCFQYIMNLTPARQVRAGRLGPLI